MSASPCIGVCSTTYGDFICRGCKRFAHEVVAWNQFSEAQREAVRERLAILLGRSIKDYLRPVSGRSLADESPHDLLKRLKAELGREPAEDFQATLQRLQLATHYPHTSIRSVQELVLAIENAFFLRSEGHYEHSFSTNLQTLVRPVERGEHLT